MRLRRRQARNPRLRRRFANELLARTADRLKQQGLDAKLESRGLLITLPQTVLFSSSDDRISPSAQPIIAEIASALRQSDNKVELAGHADSLPIHNRRFSNGVVHRTRFESAACADRGYGIDKSRLTVSTHGALSPEGVQ